MALTGKVIPYKHSVSGGVADVFRIPFPVAGRGVSVEDSLRALDSLFQADIEPARVAAIIVEPVQGEGGFHVAPAALLEALRRVCDRHGIVLIADEVQSGFGRTGRLFAMEHSGVQPDLVTVAKSLAGGFPLAGVIGRAPIMESVEPGGLGGTYGGSPVGCAAALAVLDVIEEERLLERATRLGAAIRERMSRIALRDDVVPIANVRGLGAMIGFDIVKDIEAREPDGATAKLVTARAFERGLVVLSCGTFGETIRILVPLTVSDAVLREGLDALEQALAMPENT
jgi:4-aminobutyrate aminotransferase/(S)-3-amino-2-methylpropionate transaminase